MNLLRYLALGAVLIILPIKASSQRKLLIETGSLHDESPSRSVTVLSSEDIQANGARPLVDVLDSVPALEVQREGGLGQIARVLIRGARSSDTLVLIDGIEVNDVIDPRGAFDFGSLTASDVERVEVYRGPQGVRFGSGAIGGVVNIITRRGRSSQPLYRFEAGSYESWSATLGMAGQNQKLNYTLSATRSETGGFSAASENRGNTEPDGARVQQVHTKWGLKLSPQMDVEAVARYADLAMDVDFAGGEGGDDPNYTSWSRGLQAGVTLNHQSTDRSSSQLSYTHSELKRETENLPDPQRADFHKDSFEGRLSKTSAEHMISFSNHHLGRVGLEYRSESGSTYGNYGGFVSDLPDLKQSLFATHATYIFESDTWFADAGRWHRSERCHRPARRF